MKNSKPYLIALIIVLIVGVAGIAFYSTRSHEPTVTRVIKGESYELKPLKNPENKYLKYEPVIIK